MTNLAHPETTSLPITELKSNKDGPVPTKRKPEVSSLDEDNSVDEISNSSKKPNLGLSSGGDNDASIPDAIDTKDIIGTENGDNQADEEGEKDNKDLEDDVGEEDSEGGDDYEDYGDDEDDDDNDDDDEDEDEDEDEEYGHVNGAVEVVDRKGKGIMKDEKGKGKLVEESEDSSDCASESDGDSELSDDPLAEVDLDNILPTRTRRKTVQPGVRISSARGSKEDQDYGRDSKS